MPILLNNFRTVANVVGCDVYGVVESQINRVVDYDNTLSLIATFRLTLIVKKPAMVPIVEFFFCCSLPSSKALSEDPCESER